MLSYSLSLKCIHVKWYICIRGQINIYWMGVPVTVDSGGGHFLSRVVVKVKVLSYSLHPVILLCWLHKLPQIIGPVHSWFHLNSTGSIQPGCSLAHRIDQLTMSSLPSLYNFLLLWYEGAVVMGLPKTPTKTDSAKIRTHDILIIGMAP